jgi:hypothetical protein
MTELYKVKTGMYDLHKLNASLRHCYKVYNTDWTLQEKDCIFGRCFIITLIGSEDNIKSSEKYLKAFFKVKKL